MPIVLFADTLDEICSYKRAKELEKTLGEVVVDFVTSSAAGHDTFVGNNDQSFISLVISHLSPVSANPGTQKKTACKTQEGGRRKYKGREEREGERRAAAEGEAEGEEQNWRGGGGAETGRVGETWRQKLEKETDGKNVKNSI